MRKKITAIVLVVCTVVAMAAIAMAMHGIESKQTVIQAVNGTVSVRNADVEDSIYMLKGWQPAPHDDNIACMTLEVDHRVGLCLYLPVNSAGRLYINGAEARQYALADTLIYQLPEGSRYELELRTDHPDMFLNSNLCLYVGGMASAINSSHSLTLQRMLILGIDFAVILFAVTLYLKKRTEKYLLAFALYAFITLARTMTRAFPSLLGIPVMDLLFNLPGLSADTTVAIASLNTLWRRGIDVVVRYMILKAFMPTKLGKHSYMVYVVGMLAVSVAAVFLPLSEQTVRFIPTVFRTGIHVLELWVLIRGICRRCDNVYQMWVAWVVMMGMWIFDDISSWSTGGTYIIGTTIGTAGIYETVLLIGFVLAVNSKFASKFTEADRLAQELEQTNAGLEQIVAEKTKELQISYDQLQKTQEQKDEMVSNIAHNLKTPLFSMSGYVEMMTEEVAEDNTALREQLDVLQKNMAYVQRLVKDLLLAYRLEGGRIVFHKMKMDLRAMTEQAAELVKARCRENGVKLVSRLQEGEVSIAGDHFYLLQAVQNVLENAADCGPEGTEVSLSLFSAGERWCISVMDHGKGIAPEDAAHIFERYYSKREDGRRSSGLGLAIARDIVLAHQGEITVKSELGKGAEFMIFLPKAQE